MLSSSILASEASCYECESENQKDIGIRMINKLGIQKGDSVLDLGCVTGFLAKVLSDKVGAEGKMLAVDPDEERLKIAREMYSATNIKYIQADDRSFPSGQYNVVFCNCVIHWIIDKEGLFRHVYDNLCPGGYFAFATPDGFLPLPEIGRRVFDQLLGPQFLHHMLEEVEVYLTAEEYRKLASDAGFELVEMSTEDIYLKWKNLDHYIDSMNGWFGGEFDPTTFDHNLLQTIRADYGEGPVVQSEPVKNLEVILLKST